MRAEGRPQAGVTRPIVWAAGAFALGIAAASLSPLFCLLLLALLLPSIALSFTRRRIWIVSALLCGFALLGSARFVLDALPADPAIPAMIPGHAVLVGRIVSDVDPTLGRSGRPGAWLVLEATEAGPGRGRDAALAPAGGRVGVRLLNAPMDAADLEFGDTVRISGILRPASSRPDASGAHPQAEPKGDARARGPDGTIATLLAHGAADVTVLRQASAWESPWYRAAYRLRAIVRRHSSAAHPAERAAVLNAILLGDKRAMPAETLQDFERTGTIHILATAGLHVGVVLLMAFGALRALRVPPRSASLLTMLALALYATMAGGRPAVVRACLVAIVALGGPLFEREPDGATSLAAAALAILAFSPASLLDAGFQLSFATVITILLALPILERAVEGRPKRRRARGPSLLRRAGRWLLGIALLSAAAQLGAAPLVAYYFGQFSIVGVFANVLVVPALFVVIPCGSAAAGIGLISPALAMPFDLVTDACLRWIVFAAHACAAPEWSALALPPFPALLAWLAYACIWFGLLRLGKLSTRGGFKEPTEVVANEEPELAAGQAP